MVAQIFDENPFDPTFQSVFTYLVKTWFVFNYVCLIV